MPPRHFPFKPVAVSLVALFAVILAISSWGHRLVGSALGPVVSLVNWAGESFLQGVRALQPGQHSRQDQIHQLESRIAELETQLTAARDLQLQNAELRRAAALPPPPEWRGILAEIIARDPERWDERLRIGAGTEENIATGAVVMVDGMVIGRVHRTERHTAEVVTILSDECRFGVELEGTGEVGVLQGLGARRWSEGQPGFQVNYLPRDLTVQPGQRILTSGLGGWMPDGLLVGHALPSPNPANALQVVEASFGRLQCAPLAPMTHCHFVTVLVPQ